MVEEKGSSLQKSSGRFHRNESQGIEMAKAIPTFCEFVGSNLK